MHGIKFNSLRQFLLKNYNKETWERHNNLLALRVFLIHLFSLAVKQFFFFCFSLLCFTSQWRYVHVVWVQSIFKPLAIHHFFPYFVHFEYISVRTFRIFLDRSLVKVHFPEIFQHILVFYWSFAIWPPQHLIEAWNVSIVTRWHIGRFGVSSMACVGQSMKLLWSPLSGQLHDGAIMSHDFGWQLGKIISRKMPHHRLNVAGKKRSNNWLMLEWYEAPYITFL